jgi:hypothetical protein
VADAYGSFEAQRIDGREDICPESDPVEVQAGRNPGLSLPTQIGRRALQAVSEAPGEGVEDPAMEARGVHQQGRRALASEVVHGDADPVWGRGSCRRH